MPENYNTNLTTHSGVSPLFAPHLNRYLIAKALPRLVFAQFGQKVKVPKGKGKTIVWDKAEPLPLATTPLTEGVAPDGASLTVTRVSGEPLQYGNYVATSDEFDFYKYDPPKAALDITELLGENAAETQDMLTRCVLAGGTNVQYAGGKTARSDLAEGDVLKVADIMKAVAYLKTNRARPFEKSYVCIIDPFTAHDLMNDEQWQNVKMHDPKNLYEGEIGELYGVRFVVTTETAPQDLIDANETNGTKIHFAYIMGQDAYGVTDPKGNLETITHDKHSIGGPLDQYSTIGWKGHHLAKILVQNWLIRIECVTTL